MGWTLFFMMVVLKIPMIFAAYVIWYAIREEPDLEAEPGTDTGPRRRMPPFPRWPRRGPAGGGAGCDPVPCPQQAQERQPIAGTVARSRD